MKQNVKLLTALVLAAGSLTASVTGCELIASVDRSKIAGGGGSGGGSGGAASSSSGTGGMSSSSSSGTGGMSSSSSSGTGGMSSSSSSGVGGSSSSSSSGGGACGTGTTCTTATECPATNNECVLAACNAGCCDTTNATDGAAVTTGQTAKDCKKLVCDGNGGTKPVDDDADVPDAMDDCHVGVCVNGAPSQDLKTEGDTCGTNNDKVCTDTGLCVQCNVDADCTAPLVCDPANNSHTCVDAGCTDGAKNNGETDTDCGGPNCGATCANGATCAAHTDCIEGNCDAGTNKCVAATCSDSLQDGAQGAEETDVDCGGPCVSEGKKCAVTKGCKLNNDCASGYCDATNHCATPTCNDGVKNGDETDQDCGGSCAASPTDKTCDNGKHCGTATDCTTGFCNGSTCDTKANGAQCGSNGGNSECTSDVCGIGGSGNCCAAACTTGTVCGATGCAGGTGACQYPTNGTNCGASCTGHTLTVSTCNGSGTCSAGTPTACAGGFICASATACKTTCTADTDCASSSDYCQNPGPSGACVPKGAAGATCGGNNQCSTGKCGTSGTGHCCTASCPSAVAACGATDCDGTGACAYPGNTTAPAGLQTPGDCQKVVCNGSGGAISADDAIDTPTSNSACLISPSCQGPSPLTPHFDPAPATTSCTEGSGSVCGDPSNSLIAGTCVQCNTNADCLAVNDAGTLACDTSTGTCQ